MTPILYSFRRCPYAMRARLALNVSGIEVELREILLRDKPAHMLEISPKGTVPVLMLHDRVIDESLDIMTWALRVNDPMGWLDMPSDGHQWIERIDGPFKQALDRYKYPTRYTDIDRDIEREKAASILRDAEPKLIDNKWIFGENASLADMASLTFIRQFANVDRAWFDAQDWPNIRRWLDDFLASDAFQNIMQKYPQWSDGDDPVMFGGS